MPPANAPPDVTLLANSVADLSRSVARDAQAKERMVSALGNIADEADIREREWQDTVRRIFVEVADREKQWVKELGEIRAALLLIDRGQQDVKGEVKDLREETGEHDLAEIRAVAVAAQEFGRRNRQRTPTESDPPPGRLGAAGYLLKQWGRQTTVSKILLIILFGMMWAVGGHAVLRWLEGKRDSREGSRVEDAVHISH